MGNSRIGQWLVAVAVLSGCAGGKGARDSAERVGSVESAVVTETTFTGVGPAGVSRTSLALAASNSLALADRVKVLDSAGNPGAVAAVGAGTANIGVDAKIGDLWSRGPLVLRERARVTGVAEAAGTVTKQNGVVVTGGIKNSPLLKAATLLSFGATFDTPCGGSVNLEPDKQRSLVPNSYAAVSVKSRSTLSLKTGTYRFDSLSLEPQAKLALDTALGPVVIFVKSTFTFRGSVTGNDAASNLLIALGGTSMATVEAPFQGSIVAPSAKIKLAAVASPGHAGSFFAKDIEVAPDTTVTLKPFAWGSVLSVGGTRLTARVSALGGDSSIALPDMTVELSAKNQASCGAESYRVLSRQITDASGMAGLSVPPAAGTLRLCASGPGFSTSCSEIDPAHLPEPLAELSLSAPHAAAYGKVLAADGSLCGAKRAGFATDVKARVSLSRDSTVLSSVLVNSGGQYVLPLPGPGSYQLTAVCGVAQVVGNVATSDGGLEQNLSIGNRAPRILAFGAKHASGIGAQTVTAGEVVTIKLSAWDPEGTALRYRYRDAASGMLAATTSTFSYTVPSTGQITLWAEVSDAAGAYDYDVLRIGGSGAGNRFIGKLTGADGNPLANATVRVKAFSGDTLLGSVSAVTDSLGAFRSALTDADRFVVSLATPGLSPTTRIYRQGTSGITLRTRTGSEHIVDSPNDGFTVVDELLGMQLKLPAGALIDAAGQPPSGPVRVLMDRDFDGSWILGDGVLQDDISARPATSLSPAVIAIVAQSNVNDVFRLSPGVLAEVLMPTRDELTDSLIDAAKLSESGIWSRLGPAVRDEFGRYLLATSELGTIGVGRPGVGKACVRTRVDRGSMVVPLDITLKAGGRVIRSFSINDYEYHNIEFGNHGYFQIEATPNSPSLLPGHDQFAISHQIWVSDADKFPGLTFGPCETRNDLFRRDIPEHERYFSRGPENDEAYAKDYYDEVDAYSAMGTLAQFKTGNGFDAGGAVEARFYNRNELGIGRALTCRRDSSVLACYLVKYGEPGGPVDETLDDLMNDTNPADTVAMQWTRRHGTRFFIYSPAGKLKTSTHFDLEGEKFAPGVCRGCHGSGTFVPVDPTTHLYRNDSERNAASEAIRKINKMIYDTPGSTNQSVRDYIKRLYPDGLGNSGSSAVSQMPPLYAEAERQDFYNEGVKPYCQLCHLGDDRPDWTTSPMALSGKLEVYACQGNAMPHAFVPHRNLWVSGMLPSVFGCDDWEPPASIWEDFSQPEPTGPTYCQNCPCTLPTCAPVGCVCPCTDCSE